jgi:hypothetical protein
MEPPPETRPELVVVCQEAPPQPPEDPTLQSLMCKVNQTNIHSFTYIPLLSLFTILTLSLLCFFRAVR